MPSLPSVAVGRWPSAEMTDSSVATAGCALRLLFLRGVAFALARLGVLSPGQPVRQAHQNRRRLAGTAVVSAT